MLHGPVRCVSKMRLLFVGGILLSVLCGSTISSAPSNAGSALRNTVYLYHCINQASGLEYSTSSFQAVSTNSQA
ncbi:hypothetical protein M8J77_003176 [Diaphorina citri]|nr:hypothetical protein M8J77_003176 [Diaphorina citri]